MTAESPFTPDEIVELRKLLEIEKIRKVKNFYSHLMDMRDIDALIKICTDDCVCEYGPYGVWRGRKEIYDGWKAVFAGGVPYGGFHATTNQWIELTSPTTAVSRCYLHDISNEPDPRSNPVVWYGVYDENYVKIDGEWKMSFCRLEFLWPKRQVSDEFPRTMPGIP